MIVSIWKQERSTRSPGWATDEEQKAIKVKQKEKSKTERGRGLTGKKGCGPKKYRSVRNKSSYVASPPSDPGLVGVVCWGTEAPPDNPLRGKRPSLATTKPQRTHPHKTTDRQWHVIRLNSLSIVTTKVTTQPMTAVTGSVCKCEDSQEYCRSGWPRGCSAMPFHKYVS